MRMREPTDTGPGTEIYTEPDVTVVEISPLLRRMGEWNPESNQQQKESC